MVGLRRRHLYGCTRHSVLSATVQVAGPGDGRGGVQPRHRIARLGKVLSEECKTGISELGVKQASSSFCDLYRVVVFSARENAYGLLPSKENVFIIS